MWICQDASGHIHIQATGRDARGVRTPITGYARVQKHMGKRGAPPREKGGRRLLDKTLIRAGNGEYAKENGTYGLTTLSLHPPRRRGLGTVLSLQGQSGKTWRLRVKDRRGLVRAIQDLPGQHPFQHVDEAGLCRSVDSSDVNAYLPEIADSDVSAK